MYVCPGWAQRAHGQASFTGSENMRKKQRRVKGYTYQLQPKASEGSQSACFNFSERNIHTPDTAANAQASGRLEKEQVWRLSNGLSTQSALDPEFLGMQVTGMSGKER